MTQQLQKYGIKVDRVKYNSKMEATVYMGKDVYKRQGVYYGGTIVAPVVAEFYENILPYLGVEKSS